ncbi:MAG: deoxyribodipyrimidine photo-lyase, partial [Halieaceae bacterium]
MAAHGRLIFWFRQDLRLSDLPALVAAQRDAEEIIPLYVLDDAAAGDWSSGAASRWWLHQSLTALGSDIAARAGQLVLRSGDSLSALQELCAESGADAVYCSRRYEPWASAQEEQLHAELDKSGVLFKRFPGSLLHEPGRVLTQAGGPFKVFTPFWRACLRQELAVPAPRVDPEWSLTSLACATEQLDDWKLCPRDPDWAADWGSLWQPGETGARERLRAFLAAAVGDYSAGRDYPGAALTSRLSAHLHHGELSPRQVWAACEQRKLEAPETAAAIGKFQSELGWREFSYHLLHFFPGIPETPFKGGFRGFPWVSAPPALKSWQQGQTGYPIVDAGMRELWQTGCMHNRVRMVVASFLCKHLL